MVDTGNGAKGLPLTVACVLIPVLAYFWHFHHAIVTSPSTTPSAHDRFASVAAPSLLTQGLFKNLTCLRGPAESYGATPVSGCTPTVGTSQCGRVYKNNWLDDADAKSLITLINTAMAHTGGASGPAAILDMTSGAASKGTKFVDIFRMLKSAKIARQEKDKKTGDAVIPDALALFLKEDVDAFFRVAEQFKATVATTFGIPAHLLHLTRPAFISRLDGDHPAKTKHDEYWHEHVDTLQYGTFSHTGIIYLNSQGEDYEGGDFEFVDRTQTKVHRTRVHPQKGGLLLFSSDHENRHRVVKVTKGIRYALIIATTCDAQSALNPVRSPTLTQLLQGDV